ncbi:glycosyltransferase family 4 protein [Pedobacter sp.]|uniref:glycosyltransferase family 4 protein n=1 Tax=Pedobacter sp. TaxID=1411316 RepID=UPI003D7F59E4
MKIAVLAPVAWRTPPRHYGPWEQMASNLCEGLVKAGVDVTLFATGDSLTAGKLDYIIEKGYEEDRTQDAKVLECLHISYLMEKADSFDLIHNHFDFLPLTYSRLINTPMVTTIHGFSSGKIIRVYQKYNDTSQYVSISNANRHPSLRYAATIYNGLDNANFSFKQEADDYLLFFGRLHPDKGVVEAIEIAKKSNRKLKIAGIIQDEHYYKTVIEPLLNEQITFLGAAESELRNELLGNAYALLHPINFAEPFGLSVAEAMLCGTPVIAFNKGSMPELINHGTTGFLVHTLEEAVDAVAKIPTINREICREWAMSKFTTEKMVDGYLTLYHQILNG